MALQLNGDGTITGLAEGGLEDAKIINADIKDDTIAEEKLDISNSASDGQFLQYENSSNKLTWATVSSTPEGNVIKSTTNGNEAATKFLRADGDGTCSWQIPTDTGKILQVVGNLNTGGGTSTTSTDWTETYITDTITPTALGSKIAVFATGMGGYLASSSQGFANCTLGRNVNSEGWAYMGDGTNGMAYIYSQAGASGWYAVTISYLDSPTYTSGEAIEYSVFIKCNTNVSTTAIGNGNSHSPIILMEVAA